MVVSGAVLAEFSGADMRRFRFVFALALLLVFAQQGALLHELSHVYRTGTAELNNEATVPDGTLCATCLAFAQAANPASGALIVPPVVAAVRHVSPNPEFSIIAASAPAPRSRGPPILL
jgi:hypothetical protein